MPLYDYKCRACSKVTEVRHGFREPYQGSCPSCGGDVARVFNPAGIVFKGSGFYLTDSRKQASDAPSKAPDGAAKSEPSTPATPAAAAAPAPSADAGSEKSDASAA